MYDYVFTTSIYRREYLSISFHAYYLALSNSVSIPHLREPPENQRITHDLTTELKKLVKKHSELGLLPMECNYLNRNAFMAAAGSQVGVGL